MFGFCVWAELNKSTIFYTINRQLSYKCNSQIHNPHITLDYDIDINNIMLSSYKSKKYNKIGDVYQSQNKNFYSLQQDYLNNDKLYHVSLAYKVNNPFTSKDLIFANSLDIPLIIFPNELTINIWNCDSLFTSEWYKYNF
jgi:hypothetical protein